MSGGGFWKSGINRAKNNIPRKESRVSTFCDLGEDLLYLKNTNWNYERCIKDILESYQEPGGAMEFFEDDYYTPSELIEMEKLAKEENDVFRFDGWFLVFANLEDFFIDLYKYSPRDEDISKEDAFAVFRCIATKLRSCNIKFTKKREFFLCVKDADELIRRKLLLDDSYELRSYLIKKFNLSPMEIELSPDGNIFVKIDYDNVRAFDKMVEYAEDWLVKHNF